MGIKTRVFLLLLSFCALLSGCNRFYSPDINLHGIRFSQVKATGSDAYFLSEDGTLYCTGSDGDASCYVLCKDEKKGIVAENVKQFDTMLCGGYYLDTQNNLYIWNRNPIDFFEYEPGQFKNILQDVSCVVDIDVGGEKRLVYIDTSRNLCVVGSFDGENYSFDSPRVLATNVATADILGNLAIWCTVDGVVDGIGNENGFRSEDIISFFDGKSLQKIQLVGGYLLFLSDGELWYYGSEERFSQHETKAENCDFHLLEKNIVDACGAIRTVVALDADGNAHLWGRMVVNDAEQTEHPENEYLHNRVFAQNVVYAYIVDGCLCYIDNQGASHIYKSLGWTSFCGNSTDDPIVGINRDPIEWVP